MLIVRDNWAPPGLINAARAMWPAPTSGLWHAYDSGKLATKSRAGLPVASLMLLDAMAAIPVADWLGIDATAFPDVDQLHGAGLHQLDAGQSLGLHLDAERHPLMPWRREVSAVLYLDDVPSGGRLELCDAGGHVVESVESRRGRLTLFRTPGQWHRVSECGSLRRSVCLFWWSRDESPGGATRATFAP